MGFNFCFNFTCSTKKKKELTLVLLYTMVIRFENCNISILRVIYIFNQQFCVS